MLRPADWFILGVFAAVVALGLVACAPVAPREVTVCELAARHPEIRDPVVAAMFGLPTAACRPE